MTTYAVPGKAVYLRDNETGIEAQIGAFDPALKGPENRMRICPEGFENLGAGTLQKCAEAPGEWISIDEIGYLECGCAVYQAAVRQLMNVKRVIAAVRRQELPFLREIMERKDVFAIDLDAPWGNTGCVIMASGLGKRFGGNKLMADFDGTPMIGRALSATEGLFARRVVVTRHRDAAAFCRQAGCDVILHDLPYRSDTVRLGIQAMRDMDGCLFCPGDQPLLKRETVEAIALSSVNDRESIWRVCHGEQVGSPVLFPKWAFEALTSLPEGKGGGYVAAQYPEKVRTIPARDGFELMDADTREEFEMLLKAHKNI